MKKLALLLTCLFLPACHGDDRVLPFEQCYTAADELDSKGRVVWVWDATKCPIEMPECPTCDITENSTTSGSGGGDQETDDEPTGSTGGEESESPEDDDGSDKPSECVGTRTLGQTCYRGPNPLLCEYDCAPGQGKCEDDHRGHRNVGICSRKPIPECRDHACMTTTGGDDSSEEETSQDATTQDQTSSDSSSSDASTETKTGCCKKGCRFP